MRFNVRAATIAILSMAAGCTQDAQDSNVVAPSDQIAAARGSADLSSDGGEPLHIAIRDECDPNSPWPGGVCALRKGPVTTAEFDGELISPLADAVVGHPAWRNDPPYAVIKEGQSLLVRNEGGRPHTFTRVANFGAGKLPPFVPLNFGLDAAPECQGSADIAPGGSTRVGGLAAGSHRFQCCFHPWMRAVVEVESK